MECVIIGEENAGLVELCGLTVRERLRRTLRACGCDAPCVLAEDLPNESWPEGLFLAVRGDYVFDARLLQLLGRQTQPTALVDGGEFCGAAVLNRASWRGDFEASARNLATINVAEQDWYLAGMRRNLRAYWFPEPTPANRRQAENVILDAAQKGTLDIPALVHAPIETFIVSKLCWLPITPNQLTVFCNLVAWCATALFATGHLLIGIFVALAVGVLDGLDGKLARVKLETSKAGELEHLFDVFFENSWWIAIAYHLRASGKLPNAFWYLALLLGAEILAGLARGSIVRFFGKSISELSAFDRLVRLIGGRRNVYVWILAAGIFLGHAIAAFKLIAWWELATAAIHLPRAAWAVATRPRR